MGPSLCTLVAVGMLCAASCGLACPMPCAYEGTPAFMDSRQRGKLKTGNGHQTAPNYRLQATPNSFRSCVASAIGRA
jgi:hypothetical protein